MTLQRLWWALGALLVAAAIVICLVPGTELPEAFEWNDKLSHVAGHGAMAVYFAGLVPRRGWWKIFAFLLLLGISIECAQYYMHAGREGDPRDVLANAVGALFGLVLGRLGLARWPELAAWLLGRAPA
ncbi:MAG TPA: VanZ family protein [Steroidobacteraceae bacterium]|jgi:VanZ family protein|nr:VanZ family protein [Steroidobacteraceae bacterium]